MADESKLSGKKLYRSHENRMIAGVCGGVAEYFELDPTLIRIAWVAVALFGGVGVLVYLAAIFIIPNNPGQEPGSSENLVKDKPLFWGSLLIVIGALLLFKQMGLFNMFQIWHMPWQMVWAIFLIVVGGVLLYNRSKEKEAETDIENAEPVKKLYRSRDQKMISGVCGGLSEYFELDVSLIRILWVIATLASAGLGILAYIVMILVFPEEPDNVNATE